MSAASDTLGQLLQRDERLTMDEYFEVLNAIIDVFDEDEGEAFAARAALEQMRVSNQLPPGV